MWAPALAASCLVLLVGTPLQAQDAPLPPITVGAGVQTSFVHTDTDAEDSDSTDAFLLDSARLYVNGSVTNTDQVHVQHRIPRRRPTTSTCWTPSRSFEFSPKFNIWAGRFLPPSDRANLYGPYYAHHWAVFTDGVQDGYPFIFQGRANGVAVLGAVRQGEGLGRRLRRPVGSTGDDTSSAPARVQVDFWDPEDGYYLNGTYYGEKNLLAVGAAGQVQGERQDGLERRLPAGAEGRRRRRLTVEAEWAKYDQLGGYNARLRHRRRRLRARRAICSRRLVGIGPVRDPRQVRPGEFHATASTPLDATTTRRPPSSNLNYVIKQFNARVMIFFKDTRSTPCSTDFMQFGVGLQIQM